MGLVGYMTLKGKNQGEIKGSSAEKSYKDAVVVLQFDHTVKVPYGDSNATVRGDSQHDPLIIYKEWDKSTPALYKALVTGEHFEKVEIKWVRMNGQKYENFFTHTLHDAKIVNVNTYMYHRDDPERGKFPQHMEAISFVYTKLDWVWVPDGVTCKYDVNNKGEA